jgi:hypothetical protein
MSVDVAFLSKYFFNLYVQGPRNSTKSLGLNRRNPGEE